MLNDSHRSDTDIFKSLLVPLWNCSWYLLHSIHKRYSNVLKDGRKQISHWQLSLPPQAGLSNLHLRLGSTFSRRDSDTWCEVSKSPLPNLNLWYKAHFYCHVQAGLLPYGNALPRLRPKGWELHPLAVKGVRPRPSTDKFWHELMLLPKS